MRKPVFYFGLVMWVLVGLAAYITLRQGGTLRQGPAASPTGQVTSGADATTAGQSDANPKGKQAIVIKPLEPVAEAVAPPGWEPPVVEGWTLTNHLGETVTPESLRGKPYVATFIFTRCSTHCPDLVRRVYDLEQRLKDVDVRFVTVSVDPDYDTVEHLAKYAEIFTQDADRWMFLTGDKDQILEFARYGSRQMRTEPLDAETFIGPQAAHSLRLMHVGADGRMIGSYHFQREEDMLALRRVLEGKAETRAEHKPLPAADELVPVMFQADDLGTQESPEQVDSEVVTGGLDLPVDPLANLPTWARRLPPINASMNGCAAVLLVIAFVAIKKGKRELHGKCMVAAVVVSAVFLIGYAVYHIALGQYTDSHGKPFDGVGIARTVYYSILIPHVILAATVPVLAGMAIYRAVKERWDSHKRIAKVAYPVWMFVSVTGVVIYFMLYHWPTQAV